MKKILIYFLFACITSLSYSQELKNDTLKLDKKKFLKELSENACKCIDSIYTYNKKKDSITSEIHRCIDQQVGAYQLGIKFSNIEKLKEAAATVDGKKEINISLSLDPNSKEYKEYYYEIEEYLMGNCSSIKKKMAENLMNGLYFIVSAICLFCAVMIGIGVYSYAEDKRVYEEKIAKAQKVRLQQQRAREAAEKAEGIKSVMGG
jgi:hypothetical protein